MIVSETAQFVIATPTKTGSSTLKYIARKDEKHHSDQAFSVLHTGDKSRFYQHRMIPHIDSYDRYIMVRNPARRYLSIYDYMRSYTNYAAWSANLAQGDEWPDFLGRKSHGTKQRRHGPVWTFAEYLWFYVDARDKLGGASRRRGDTAIEPRSFRAPWVWLDSLTDSRAYLARENDVESVGILKLENIWDEFADLKEYYSPMLDHVSFSPIWSNKSKSVSHSDVWHETMSEQSCGNGECGDNNCLMCRLGVVQESAALGYLPPIHK